MLMRRATLGQTGTGKSILLRHRILESERCLFFDPLREWTGRHFTNLDELEGWVSRRQFFRWAYWPEDPESEADPFVGLCQRVGRITVAFDEADLFAPTNQVSKPVKSFLLRSRHDGISIEFATQRPAAISRFLLSQANSFTSFRLVDPRDLDAVRPYFHAKTDLLPTLKNGEHIEVNF